MPYANNKGADQPAHPCILISAFVVCCLDSIISLVSIFAISRLASLCNWAGRFVSYMVANPEDRFSHDVTSYDNCIDNGCSWVPLNEMQSSIFITSKDSIWINQNYTMIRSNGNYIKTRRKLCFSTLLFFLEMQNVKMSLQTDKKFCQWKIKLQRRK